MGQLEQHLIHDRPRWSGDIRLDYTDGAEWIEDLGLLRRRLGWRILACDSLVEQTLAYVGFDNGDPDETTAVLHLPLQSRGSLPETARLAFGSGEGRMRFLDALNRIPKEPYIHTPGATRWERLANGETLALGEGDDEP